MRRTTSPFSLSLLDLLTSALGAVILLFVLVPKGGAGAATAQQASVFFDTATMQIHGVLPDSLTAKRAGDTLFALLVDYRAVGGPDVGGLEAELAAERRRVAEAEAARQRALAHAERASTATERAEAARRAAEAEARAEAAAARAAKTRAERIAAAKPPAPEAPQAERRRPDAAGLAPQAPYTGTLPSVPAAVSFELSWADKSDNVDLFVCRGTTCVYGERKRDRDIGQWDSGKSRNRLFGNDLRTTQEAVRQFDGILPGTYTVYARFKESGAGRASTEVNGLVYTKGPDGTPRGETYAKTLKLGEPRTRLVTVTLRPDGTFSTR